MPTAHAPVDKPDIVATIENEGISLKKRGRDLWAPCPFHSEKSPSFKVSTEKQVFHCFGCGQGGDVITFIMLHRSLSFKDALAYLRLDAGAGRQRQHFDSVKTKKQQLVKSFRKWEQARYRELCRKRLLCVRLTRDLVTMEDVEKVAIAIHSLPLIEHELDILWHGSDEEKFLLWKEDGEKTQ